ncbi:hypothetical protein A2U01_0107815, partial [Trifolium medium]|nr:hypothetical protein [Trifolium medium]
FCYLRVAQGLMARCTVVMRKVGKASVICVSRMSGWRVAPVS